MIPPNFDEVEANRQFDDALARSGTRAGPSYTIGTIIWAAEPNGYKPPHQQMANKSTDVTFDLAAARPVYYPHGMPPREFVGPDIGGGTSLFPLAAISMLVALGGAGKTTFAIKMAAHIAAGKRWDQSVVKQRRVIVFNVEESQDELNRKYGASVNDWIVKERGEVEDNLRLISCLGIDALLTKTDGRQVVEAAIADKMIQAAQEFGATVIVIDHIQGFVSGDMNLSDTATVFSKAANKIVAATGAAVIMAAHIAKRNIGAQEVDHGFSTGSLAFENAARQVVGIIPMSDADAEKYGMEPIKKEYLCLEMPKNSYGPAGGKAYLKRVYVPDFHTITVEPFVPTKPISGQFKTANERLCEKLVNHLTAHPGLSKNKLDQLAGKNKTFNASKQKIQNALRDLVDNGEIEYRDATDSERSGLNLLRQKRKVYMVVP
jgi:RecA-family ATPase